MYSFRLSWVVVEIIRTFNKSNNSSKTGCVCDVLFHRELIRAQRQPHDDSHHILQLTNDAQNLAETIFLCFETSVRTHADDILKLILTVQ